MVNWPAKLRQMISGVPMPSLYSNLFLNVGASPGGVLNFELGTDVRPEVLTTTL